MAAALDNPASLRTRISSESITVDSRCAMTSVVRASTPVQGCLDFLLGTAVERRGRLVEQEDEGVRMARAMATRCFSPPESFSPRSPTMVSYFSGSKSMNPSMAAIRDASSISASLAPSRP